MLARARGPSQLPSRSMLGPLSAAEPTAAPSAAAEHAEAGETGVDEEKKDPSSGWKPFLALGLRDFAKDLAPVDREYDVALALFEACSKPKQPGDHATLGSEEGDCLAKMWDHMTLTPQKQQKGP